MEELGWLILIEAALLAWATYRIGWYMGRRQGIAYAIEVMRETHHGNT